MSVFPRAGPKKLIMYGKVFPARSKPAPEFCREAATIELGP